jgi:hypothetical protein
MNSQFKLGVPPFDYRKLDTLMAEDDLDVLFVTSKHNVQYLTGGYRSLTQWTPSASVVICPC